MPIGEKSPYEEASFVDDALLEAVDGTGPASDEIYPDISDIPDTPDLGAPSESSEGSLAEFERAFVEGLPAHEAPPVLGTSTPGSAIDPAVSAARDVSAQLSEESFQITNEKAARASSPPIGGADRQTNAEPEAPAASQNWRRLARSLTHEIRNPLHAIGGALTIIQKRTRKDSLVDQSINVINEEIKR